MTASIAELIIKLQDDASAHAKKVAESLKKISQAEKEVGSGSAAMQKLTNELRKQQEQLGRVGSVRTMQQRLSELTATYDKARQRVRELGNALQASANPTERMQRAYEKAAQHVKRTTDAISSQKFAIQQAEKEFGAFGNSANKLVTAENRVKEAIEQTTAALRKQVLAEQNAAKLEARRERRRAVIGTMASGGAMYVGAKASEAVRGVGHTYREFDKERRYGKAVMGITDAEQAPLIDQAIHMGATTKYNDVQVLEAQRDLAARGVRRDAILGMMPDAATLGQGFDLSLPDAVKQMEGAIFTFKKDVSTVAAAAEAARQTADVQVKASKISGMTPEDIRQIYKYGGTPAYMAGISEQNLLAFGAISKKANIGGDEAGVAFRALMAFGQKPTRGAKEAMLANGLDYSNYQRNPDRIEVDPFVKNVAAQYGVALNEEARAGLKKIFEDKSMISDPAKFTPAVMGVLADNLDGDDAKAKKSIAGMANRFRDASMRGVDINALIEDLMPKIAGNLALANAVFGSKQGGRIATALGDSKTFKHMIDELNNHSDGYAKSVSDERMGGFDGAVSRFEGAVKNLETAVGRSLDNSGTGGFLTNITDATGKFVQGLAEANPNLLAFGSAAGLAASKVAEFSGAWGLVNNLLEFKSATALTAAAGELTVAARALQGAAATGGAADAAGGAKGGKKGGKWNVAAGISVGAAILAAGQEGMDYLFPKLPHPTTTRTGKPYDPEAEFNLSIWDRARRMWGGYKEGPNTWATAPATSDMSLRGMAAKYPQGAAGVSRAPNAGWTPPSSGGQNYQDDVDKAKQAGGEIKSALDVTAAPKIDLSSIQAAQAAANQLVATIEKINGMFVRSPTSGQAVRGVNADVGIGAGP
ncbi:phage tail tape measure protein [Labrys sp. WJW]|uniref:phage tail tape measure protein n=1 Tax=Labrys sp. WJW TaxID=1737983 RepID=UPI00082C74A0|nr:phage tail tape measure protein [Labrys sp. WJW]OCC05101.1 phage tail tape measure protein [Labrys sp. WJW]